MAAQGSWHRGSPQVIRTFPCTPGWAGLGGTAGDRGTDGTAQGAGMGPPVTGTHTGQESTHRGTDRAPGALGKKVGKEGYERKKAILNRVQKWGSLCQRQQGLRAYRMQNQKVSKYICKWGLITESECCYWSPRVTSVLGPTSSLIYQWPKRKQTITIARFVPTVEYQIPSLVLWALGVTQ